MRLGARWSAGDPPHRSVPSVLRAAIAAAEAAHPHEPSWTLTWLEGRAVCSLGDAVTVREADAVSANAGAVDDPDEDWLS